MPADDGLVKYGKKLMPPNLVSSKAQYALTTQTGPEYDWRKDDLYYAADRIKAKRAKES